MMQLTLVRALSMFPFGLNHYCTQPIAFRGEIYYNTLIISLLELYTIYTQHTKCDTACGEPLAGDAGTPEFLKRS